eukprot:TRINITY_DN10782_c0_g1_i2.p1 TRINITY_DN10782_c0_g1~~TRINITY_DN10782_c0_g1_i2.p1  ORF type:complete len:202 (+),score=35.45 TRINITY_DN10782_c0_g1_i2:63-668(+)
MCIRDRQQEEDKQESENGSQSDEEIKLKHQKLALTQTVKDASQGVNAPMNKARAGFIGSRRGSGNAQIDFKDVLLQFPKHTPEGSIGTQNDFTETYKKQIPRSTQKLNSAKFKKNFNDQMGDDGPETKKLLESRADSITEGLVENKSNLKRQGTSFQSDQVGEEQSRVAEEMGYRDQHVNSDKLSSNYFTVKKNFQESENQ